MKLDTTSPHTLFRLSVTSGTTYQRLTIAEGTIKALLGELEGSTWDDDPDPSYALQSTSRGCWGLTTTEEVLKLQRLGLVTGQEARQLLTYIIQDA
jgi:hypothetical protein